MTSEAMLESPSPTRPAGQPRARGYHVLVGGPEHYAFFENYSDYLDQQSFWTALKGMRVGDICFVYLSAPVSRIVGHIEITGEPFYNIDMFPDWKNNWMAEFGEVVYYFPRPELTIRGLRELFTDWGWPRYPRRNTTIPRHVLAPFLELMRQSDMQWHAPAGVVDPSSPSEKLVVC